MNSSAVLHWVFLLCTAAAAIVGSVATGVGSLDGQPVAVFWTGVSFVILTGMLLINWGSYVVWGWNVKGRLRRFAFVMLGWNGIMALLAIGIVLLTQGERWDYDTNQWVRVNPTWWSVGFGFVMAGIAGTIAWIPVSVWLSGKSGEIK